MAIVVKLNICDEIASNDGGVRTRAFDTGVGVETEGSRSSVGVACSARIVADWGDDSPKIALRGGREEGRKVGTSLLRSLDTGVGVPDLVGLRSPNLLSKSNGVRDRSGDR